jgi:parallel beta-helix repeat protein
LDSEEGLLFFWPPEGSLKPTDEVVVPVLDCLVNLRGASWLKLSGFTFTETKDGDNYHHEGVEGAGPMFSRAGLQYGGDALHLKGAEFCTIERNHFDAVGCNAIYLEGSNYRNVIRGNEIGYVGANGICLLGTKLQHPLSNQVADNYIHHAGILNKYVAGVFAGMSDGNIISHNRIESVPHHAINLGNNPTGRNIAEYNFIRHACLEIADSAAINLWMEEVPKKDAERAGHVIRYNMILDTFSLKAADGKVGKESGFTSGIYLDNYSSNCLVQGNVIARAQTGVVVHAGKNNLIENNVFVDCLANVRFQDLVTFVQGKGFYKQMEGFMTGNYLTHNIFYQSDPSAFLYSLDSGWTDRTVSTSEANLYFQSGEGKYLIQYTRDLNPEKTSTFADWKSSGFDMDSSIGDPLFNDPQNDDYRLKGQSPAFKLGFVPIDLGKIGPRNQWGMAISATSIRKQE